VSEHNELDGILSRIQKDPELRDAFEAGGYSQMAANLITEMREDAGLSKAALAEKLGVSTSRIYEAERPKGSQGPTYRFMSQVAEACGFAWPRAVSDLRPAGTGEAAPDKISTRGAGEYRVQLTSAFRAKLRQQGKVEHPLLGSPSRAMTALEIIETSAQIKRSDAEKLITLAYEEMKVASARAYVMPVTGAKPRKRISSGSRTRDVEK
jgi:transcriptional regulator with XRE-family HTH domain